VVVEAILLYTIIKFRRRSDADEPKHVHGNTALEITWTIAPAVILVFIAIPTVRTIFVTQARAVPNALQVEVVGHQWWWEFRYPQYTRQGANGRVDTLVTANDLYLPIGRTVNFSLKTKDVLHSFWIPQLGGKRDLITNHTNYLWFTPDSSLTTSVYNGSCNEYCGASHANMRFRTFVVTPTEFEGWVGHQLSPAAFADSNLPPAYWSDRQLPDPRQEAQAQALMDELRCLVCQGQSIADSNAEIAGDMRDLVRRRIAAGERPAAIRAWLIQRYGSWISYKPTAEPAAWPLWLAPLALLAVGAFLVRRRIRMGRRV